MEPIALIRLSLQIVADRLIAVLGMLMSCGLACWAMFDPTNNRVITLAIFVLFAYLVIRHKESRNAGQNSQEA
jgi:hypothetical protein